MSLKDLQFNRSRGMVDVTAPLRQGLGDFTQSVRQLTLDKLAKEKAAEEARRWEIANQRNEEAAQRLRDKDAQDKALGGILSKAAANTNVLVPGIDTVQKGKLSNAKQVEDVKIANNTAKAIFDDQLTAAEAKYHSLLKDYISAPVDSKTTNKELVGENIPASSAKIYRNNKGEQVGLWDQLFGDYKKVDGFTTMSYDEANQKALKDSGLLNLTEGPKLEEVPILQDATPDKPIKGKDTYKSISAITDPKELDAARKDWSSRLYNSIMQDERLSGPMKLAAAEKIDKQADALFGKPDKPASISDQLAVQKYKKEQLEDAQFISDARKMYKDLPKDVDSVKGVQAWIDMKKTYKDFSKNKNKAQLEFIKGIYDLTNKDSDDLAIANKYLSSPEAVEAIENMTPDKLRAKLKEIQVRYDKESLWDLLNWVPLTGSGELKDALEETSGIGM